MHCRLPAGIAALVLGLAIAAPPANAQSTRSGWRTLASGDEVLALAVDPNDTGSLWVGTEAGGLVRWNVQGRTFEQFLFPEQAGLDSNQVRDLSADPTGTMWLATSNGVTQAGQTWVSYHEAHGLPSEDITAVAVASDGRVWAGTRNDGIAELAPGSASWTVHEFDEGALGPGVNSVADIAIADDDGVWVAHGRVTSGSQPALSVWDTDAASWSHVDAVSPGGTGDGPPTDQIMSIAFDGETLWAGSWAQGVLQYEGQSWTVHRASSGVCGDKVLSVAASGGEVWAACGDDQGGDGASRFDGSRWQAYSTSDGLPADVVTSVAIGSGVAYLGTNGPGFAGSGVVPVDSLVQQPLTTAPVTVPSNDVTAIEFDGSGQLWAGSRGQGLFVQRGGVWHSYTRAGTGGSLPGDVITDLEWHEDRMWITATRSVYESGTGWVDGGVAAYEPASDAWQTLRESNSDLPSDEVSSVTVDDDGVVWFGMGVAKGQPGDEAGTVHAGHGVAAYDPATSSFVDVVTYESSSQGLAGNTVVGMDSSGGQLWAATAYHVDGSQRRRGGGASGYVGATWTAWVGGEAGFQSFHGSGIETDPDPYITGDVRSVAVGGDGVVWAGTWDLESGSLTRIWPFVDSVVNRFDGTMWESTSWVGSGWISALALDASDRVWAGTSRGHSLREFSPAGGGNLDTAEGGVRLRTAGQWQVLTPSNSGLASSAVTAITVDPSTGDVWFAFENEGLSVLFAGEVPPTVTPGGPTATPRPPSTPTRQTVATVPPTAQGGATATPSGWPPVPSDTPEPPKEVPEPATLALMGAGLAGLAAWRRRRGR